VCVRVRACARARARACVFLVLAYPGCPEKEVFGCLFFLVMLFKKIVIVCLLINSYSFPAISGCYTTTAVVRLSNTVVL